MTDKKVGLALSGGAARGLAHIGVLEVLENEGIQIDMIAGTSIGALAGALYAQGKGAALIKNVAINLTRKRLVSLMDITLPRSGVIQGNRLRRMLRSILDGEPNFADLKIPFACVATDIHTGEEVIINKGSVLEGVRASIGVPGLFTLVKREGRYLVDGGLANPVPVSVLKDMGADFIIAVNVTPDVRTRTMSTAEVKEPNIINVLLQSLYIATYSLVKASLRGADIIIEPQVAEIGNGDFHRAEEFISWGSLAAREAVDKIKRQLAT